MPFFDDSGPRPEEEHNPLWRSFALLKDQLERFLLVNVLWACQTIPLLVALTFDQMPLWLRITLSLYSALILPAATVALFAVVSDLSDGLPLEAEMLWSHFKSQIKAGFLKWLPLISLFYWLALLAGYAAAQGWLIVDTLARLTFLLLLVFSLYWGPLLVYEPQAQAWTILCRSVQLFWKNPAQTLLVALGSLLALTLGVLSIGGFLLIVPALIALFQIQLYQFMRANSNTNCVHEPCQ
jgi:hypothetical protein